MQRPRLAILRRGAHECVDGRILFRNDPSPVNSAGHLCQASKHRISGAFDNKQSQSQILKYFLRDGKSSRVQEAKAGADFCETDKRIAKTDRRQSRSRRKKPTKKIKRIAPEKLQNHRRDIRKAFVRLGRSRVHISRKHKAPVFTQSRLCIPCPCIMYKSRRCVAPRWKMARHGERR